MSTKTQQTQQAAFDPQAMSAYHGLIPGMKSVLGQYMGGSGPMSSPFFQTAYGGGLQQANWLSGAAHPNIMQNLLAGNSMHPGVASSLENSAGMQNSFMRQNSFWNALNQSTGLQLQALGMAGNIRPLQTGSTSTQSMTGLGTWLPQVASAGMGMLGAYMNQPQGLTSLPTSSALNMPNLYQQAGGIPGLDYNYMSPMAGMSPQAALTSLMGSVPSFPGSAPLTDFGY